MRAGEAITAVGVTILLALTGCGASRAASSKSASPAKQPSAQMPLPSTSAPKATTPPASSGSAGHRFRQAYANAFEDFFAAYTRADQGAAPESPDLVRFSTGSGLAWAHKQISDHVKLGVAHKGYWQFRHLGAINVTKSSARVGQCMDWSHWPVVNRVTGVPFQRFAAWSQLVYADMVLTGGQWKVASIQVQAGAC